MKTLHCAIPALAFLFCSHNVGADQPLTLSFKQLSMETAVTIARATVHSCRERGYQVAVTVVDRGGHVQALLRDSLAPPITLTVSQNKARAALNFTTPTSQLSEAFANGPVARTPGINAGAGGLPIQAAGQTLGALGVSGAPGGDIDEACAQEGLELVLDDLEME